ncbi:IgA peptidase M64-domain-containing protein [Trametes meyenii]|nr:IgA peptidase M64-domain-containing protein [Trametes meyenii]
MKPFILGILTCLLLSILSGAIQFPSELVIIRRPGPSPKCEHIALRRKQHFRGLPKEGHYKRKTLETGNEHIRYITRDEDLIWALAEDVCGKRSTWDFQALIEERSSSSTNLEPPQGQEILHSIYEKPFGGPSDVPSLEIQPLITSGDSTNRVDLVFFADGYTSEEQYKFIEDAMRLAEDISGNQTFYMVKPLLNFWAAFVPSNETGIGTGGRPKDTPFGLYRDGTELRGVYYSKPEVARAACFSLGSQCDYPILMGNDPLYGGLGGEFTVITPSLANGALVLRHELGHSIIEVGEEYDGGFAYFGVNAAHNNSPAGIPWGHWLTAGSDTVSTDGHPVHPHTPLKDISEKGTHTRIERSVMPMQAYPWTLLNTSAPWSTTFNSSGTYAWHLVRFSLSGLPHQDDLRIELDGKDLEWIPRVDIGVDRWHYDIKLNRTLEGGTHEVKFTLRNGDREGQAQLCSVEILEFGDESEFVVEPGHYSLYPTFSEKNETSYRPTNEDCLMRIVTTPNFCKPCTEGLWHALLRRVNLIDDLQSGCEEDEAGGLARTLNLDLVPLAHLRKSPVDVEESYVITWVKDGAEVKEFANKTKLVDAGDAVGSYVVNVQYVTEEVRVDTDELLTSTATASVTTTCGL